MLLSGVRSSCDMLARNCDLYALTVESSAAFCSSRGARVVQLGVVLLRAILALSLQLGRLLGQLLVGLPQLLLLGLQLLVGRPQLLLLLQQAVGLALRLRQQLPGGDPGQRDLQRDHQVLPDQLQGLRRARGPGH